MHRPRRTGRCFAEGALQQIGQTRRIFDQRDDPVLKYSSEDGQNVEPTYYLPIVPMVLVNGADGIAIGWGQAPSATWQTANGSTLPSAIKASHARQGAVYAAAFGNYGMRFCYATPKKSAVYELENARDHLAALANIACRLERFLSLSRDPHELAGLLCPNYDSFYWNDPGARATAQEIWGLAPEAMPQA